MQDFDDIVFEKLNKEYGAYLLRKKYNQTVVVSIIASVLIGCTVILIPFLRVPEQKNKEIYTYRNVTFENLKAPENQTSAPLPPVSSAAPRSKASARLITPEVKYTVPEVVDSILLFDNKMDLTADSMTGVIPGQESINGSGNETGFWSESGEGEGGGGGSGGTGLYSSVDIMPKFRGGDINKFREWVQKKTVYPRLATINSIEGKVYVTFIVENDGSVTNVKVVKGVDPLIDDEALKAVMSSPKWTPGKLRGKVVRVSYLIMLNFEL